MDPLRILFSTEAREDLLKLERYIREQDGELRAELILGRIGGVIRTLAFMPGLGRPRPYLRRGARAFPVSPWQIIYTPLAGLDGIRVIRVVDARRDLPTLLGKKRKRQS